MRNAKLRLYVVGPIMISAVIALLIINAICTRPGVSFPDSPVGFIKGYSWGWTGARGEYSGPAPEQSLKALAATGASWISLAFAAQMETRSSPTILYAKNNDFMVSDNEIHRALRLAREQGFKIIMKPVVNCLDGAWRATINFETEEAWGQWWQNYEAFLLHYAQIAADTECEMFCVGCEMRSTEHFHDRWRRIIAKVRRTYKGPIVYNANHGDLESIEWFDAIDVIGVSAYWPVSTEQDASLNMMLASWKPILERLCRLSSSKWNRPILFAEIGVRSAKTCSTMPWDWQHRDLPYDGEEQARYYEAAFRSFWSEPWFVGFCWWDWKAQLYDREDGKTNTDFCAYGKPAEEVLRRWYSKAR